MAISSVTALDESPVDAVQRDLTLRSFLSRYDFSMDAICERMLERNRGTIRIQKPRVAVANLAKIMQTTLTISNRKGFHSMSLRDLAGDAELSMGALYTYFDSKETLMLMVLGEVSAAVGEVLAVTPPELENIPVARLRWLLATHIFLTEAMLPWFVFAYMEAKTFSAEGREKARNSEASTETLIANVLHQGVKQGEFDIADIDLTAAMIKPLLQDWYVKRGKYKRRGVKPEDYVSAMTNFVEAAIRVRPGRRA